MFSSVLEYLESLYHHFLEWSYYIQCFYFVTFYVVLPKYILTRHSNHPTVVQTLDIPTRVIRSRPQSRTQECATTKLYRSMLGGEAAGSIILAVNSVIFSEDGPKGSTVVGRNLIIE